MLVGAELRRAIEDMGLNPNSFAVAAGISQTAVLNLINNPKLQPKPATVAAVERTLTKACRCCGNYTEREHAWHNSTSKRKEGSRGTP